MQSQVLSSTLVRAPTRMLIVGGLHLLLIWALINGLNAHPAPVVRPSDMTSTVSIDKVVPPEPTLAPPVLNQLHLHPVVTERLPPLDSPPELAPPPALSSEMMTESGRGTDTAPPEPVVAAAAVDPHRPLTQPPYPPASIRSNEEGALALDILVGVDGHVRDARVSRSSGSSRLDQAAVNEARVHWRLMPATRNGTPFEQWLTLRVVFRLESR